MSKHKQASLYTATHNLLDEILIEINDLNPIKKESKASLIHKLVEQHSKKKDKRI